MKSDRLLTTRETCERLRVCPKTLQIYRREKRLSYVNLGHRSIRYRESVIEGFILARQKEIR